MASAHTLNLLAVDLGLRSGLALYGNDGQLRWYRSHNFGTRTRLRRAAYSILNEVTPLAYLIMEGSGPYATIWRKEAERRSISVIQVSAETWRPDLLLAREQRTGAVAKAHAERIAMLLIQAAALPPPKSLDHNAAEAILIGHWGVRQVGWSDSLVV